MKKLFALLFISMISGMIMAQIPEVSGTIVTDERHTINFF